jgi:cysteine desulfurase
MSVLAAVRALELTGVEVSILLPGTNGVVSAEQVAAAIRPNTVLVSVMLVNNETGAIQPIREIGALAKRHGVLVHCDAVQAVGKLRLNLAELNVNLLSMSGHKIGATKGVGALAIVGDVAVSPLIHGGHQEENVRAGTENTLGIIALGAAATVLGTTLDGEIAHLRRLKSELVERLKREIPSVVFHGDPESSAPHVLSLTFEGVEAEAVVAHLDAEGICVSRGSACNAARIEPSHVLSAMGVSPLVALGAIRLSWGIQSRLDDLDFLVSRLGRIVKAARAMSPFQIGNEEKWLSQSQ